MIQKITEYIKYNFNLTNSYIKKYVLKLFVMTFTAFILSGIAFYFLMFAIPEYANDIYRAIGEMFNSVDVIKDDGSISVVMLFLNNFRAAVLSYFYGFIPFLFLPILVMILNSSVIGAVLGVLSIASDINVIFTIIKYLLPHGIVEIPAIILTYSAGIRLCTIITKKIFGKAKDEKLKDHICNFIRMLIFYITPLLVIAAFIEGVILPMFIL